MQSDLAKGDEVSLGRVASLHVHGAESGAPMVNVLSMELVAGKGIAGDKRYFNRQSRRQVTLIEREQIAEHAAVLGWETIGPGVVLSNVETEGLDFKSLAGKYIRIGTEAVIYLYAPRTPCHKMDGIAPGLRQMMEQGCQGALGQIMVSGVIQQGDVIVLVNRPGQ